MLGLLSEAQLLAHFELYRGCVKKLNEIEALLTTAWREAPTTAMTPRPSCGAAIAYNDTFLHEFHFRT